MGLPLPLGAVITKVTSRYLAPNPMKAVTFGFDRITDLGMAETLAYFTPSGTTTNATVAAHQDISIGGTPPAVGPAAVYYLTASFVITDSVSAGCGATVYYHF